jgi:cytochrome bd-type quinol oxidase subunit 2
MDMEEAQEWVEENREYAYVIVCVGCLLVGVTIDFIIDVAFTGQTLKGVVTIIASVLGLFLAMLLMLHEKAKEAEYTAYIASADLSDLESAKDDKQRLSKELGEAQTQIQTLSK